MMAQCIDLDMLAGYFGGSLSDNEKIWMMRHISSCSECLEQFASASGLMGNPYLEKWEPASDEVTQSALKKLNIPSVSANNPGMQASMRAEADNFHAKKPLFGQIMESVGRITEWAETLFSVPQPALVRSETASAADSHLSLEIADLHIRIHLEESDDDKVAIKVTLRKNWDIPENVSLMLIGDRGKVFARNLRRDAARFDDIPLDTYQLIMEQNGHERGDCFFEINEKGLHERDPAA